MTGCPSLETPEMIALVSGGATGLGQLIRDVRVGRLRAKIVEVVSNHPGRICEDTCKLLDRVGLVVRALPAKPGPDDYRAIRELHPNAWWVMAGFTRRVVNYPVGKTINIHPGPVEPPFGGEGMWGDRVHEAVLRSGREGSAVTILLVDDEYDHGKVLFQCWVPVRSRDTIESLRERVKSFERHYYGWVLDRVMHETQST